MKKLKIAQVVSLYESVPPISQNGLEFVVSWLTEELVKRGHDVTLYAPGDSVTSAKLVSLLPRAISVDTQAQKAPGFFFSIWNTLIAAKEDYDIIHCHNLNGLYISPFAKSVILETVHGAHDPSFKDTFINNPEYSKSLKPMLDEFTKVKYVFVSKSQMKEQTGTTDSPSDNHTAIHNGIPVERFTFNDTPKDYLFFIGYINKNKGADAAVRIAQKLGMKLILAGNTFGQEKFFEEEIKPHLNENIQYIGPVNFEKKNELYKNAVATLAPLAWSEPFGLTIVESQACGTPVIAFDKGAAREIIKDGVTGFVVSNEDEAVEAVKKIDEIKRSDCRTWVEENFSVEKMVDEYEKFYSTITKNRHGGRKSYLQRLFLR